MTPGLLDPPPVPQPQQPNPMLGLLRGAANVIPYAPNIPSNLLAATKALKLTPQEQFLYQHGINNWNAGKAVPHPDYSLSTIYQAGVEGPGGRQYNIPTVWDGKILDWREAVKRAAAVGWDKWPSYKNPDQAEARYQAMHPYMDKDLNEYRARQDSKRSRK